MSALMGPAQTPDTAAERFDVPPFSLADRWRAVPPEAPLLLDFDETLWLRNSTEAFLDAARPRWFAALLLAGLDLFAVLLRRLPGGEAWIDPLRVALIAALCPGSLRRWREQAPRYAAEHFNHALWAVVRDHPGPTYVASLGFRRLIEPLLAASPAAGLPLIACDWGLTAAQQRRAGKRALIDTAIGVPAREAAALITDWIGDRPLLEAVRHPFRVVWPEARYQRAGQGVYLPLRYVTHIKHPNEGFLLRVLLMEDFALWWLATIWTAANPLLHTLGLAALFGSFWQVYERGYAENDDCARRFEREGVLRENEPLAAALDRPVLGWVWAFVFGVAGLTLLDADLQGALAWAGLLLALRGYYWLYNESDKHSRTWLYPGLQLFRAWAPAALLTFGLPGLLAGLSLALSRWVPYFAYRVQGGAYQHVHQRLIRLQVWLMLLAAAALAGVELAMAPTVGLSAWLLLLALPRLRDRVKGWRSIRRDRLH